MFKALAAWLTRYPLFSVDVVLVLLGVLFVPAFASTGNLVNFGVQLSALGICAVGLTMVILAGGITVLPLGGAYPADAVDLYPAYGMKGWSTRAAGRSIVWVDNATGTPQLWAMRDPL